MADDDRIYMIDDLPIHHGVFSTSLYVKLPESNGTWPLHRSWGPAS